jgi:hypothetical protein
MICNGIEYVVEKLPNIIFNNSAFKYDIISSKYREICFLIPRYDYERFSSSINEELFAFKRGDGWYKMNIDSIYLYPDVMGYENHFELKVVGAYKIDEVELRDMKLSLLIN